MKEERSGWSLIAEGGALIIAIISAGFSAYSSITAHQALQSTEQISHETQRQDVFGQFQDQYRAMDERFPKRLHDPNFRPNRGSDE